MGAGGKIKGTKSRPKAAPSWKCKDQQDPSTLIKVLLLLGVGFVLGIAKKITFGELGLRGVTTGERRGNLPQEVAGEQIRGHGSSHSKLLSCR